MSGIAQSDCRDGRQSMTSMTTMTTAVAIRKSNRFDSTAEIGKTSFGKAIFVTRLELAMRLLVAKRSPEMKNDHGTARTMTALMSSAVILVPDHWAAATRTRTPAPTIRPGIRMDQNTPIMDCL